MANDTKVNRGKPAPLAAKPGVTRRRRRLENGGKESD